MKKLLKILGVLVVIVLVLIGAGSVALRIFLPPAKAKALVEKQLTSHLKREVSMGDVSVGVLTGLDVSDLKISEAPTFSQGTFLSSDHFSIQLSLLPLLFKKVEVSRLTLKHPVIHIVRLKDGKTFNFSDLIGSPVPAPAPMKRAGWFETPLAYADAPPSANAAPAASNEPSFALVVSMAQIEDGVIHFVDQSPARQSADIEALNLKVKNVSLTDPFSVQTDLTAKSKGVVAKLDLAGTADLASGSFKFKKCELSSGGSTILLSGEAEQLKSGKPVVNLQLDVKEFKLASVAPFLPLPPELKMNGPILGNAQVKGDQQKMRFKVLADFSKVDLVYGKQFSKPTQVPMGVSVEGQLTDLQNVDLDALKATLGSLELKAHGKIQDATSSQPQLNLHLESNAFPPMELVGFAGTALPKGLTLRGNAQLSADLSGTLTSSHVAAKIEGKDLGITVPDQFAKNPGVPLRVSVLGEVVQPPAHGAKQTAVRSVNFQSIEAGLGSAMLTGSGSFQTSGSSSKFQLTMKSNSFAIQDLAAMIPAAAPYHPVGNAILDVRASGNPSAPAANGSLALQNVGAQYQQSQLTQLNGTISFTQQDVSIPKLTGKLNGSDLSLKLTGHHLTTQPDVNVDATIAQLDLGKLLPPPAPAPTPTSWMPLLISEAWAAPAPSAFPGPMKLAGHLVVGHVKHPYYDAKNLDFSWNLSDVTPDLTRVTGLANLKQGAGQLNDVEQLAQQSKLARLVLSPITAVQKIDKSGSLTKMGLPSLQRIPFDGIRGDYIFQIGVMTIHVFELVGHDLNINMTGTIGELAGDPLLNLRVVMKLAAGALGGSLGQWTADESGRPTIPFTVTGHASAPNVVPDLHDITKRAVQQIGQQLFKNFGGGQSNSNSPDNNQQSAPQQQNPIDQLKNLKNIFH